MTTCSPCHGRSNAQCGTCINCEWDNGSCVETWSCSSCTGLTVESQCIACSNCEWDVDTCAEITQEPSTSPTMISVAVGPPPSIPTETLPSQSSFAPSLLPSSAPSSEPSSVPSITPSERAGPSAQPSLKPSLSTNPTSPPFCSSTSSCYELSVQDCNACSSYCEWSLGQCIGSHSCSSCNDPPRDNQACRACNNCDWH